MAEGKRAQTGGGREGPALGPGGVPLSPAKEDGVRRPPGLLDYYLGTKEGRARLIMIIWVLSLIVTGIGYGLMAWIFMRGGL